MSSNFEDDNTETLIFCKFPDIKVNTLQNKYEGYLRTNWNKYEIVLTITAEKNLNLKITDKLKPFQNLIQNLYSLKNPINFLDQLQSLLLKSENSTNLDCDTTIDKIVLTEYLEFRKFFVNIHKAKLSSNLREIYIATLDEAKRLHELLIETNYTNVGKLFNVVKCDLPEFIDQSTFASDDSLIAIYDKYKSILEDPKMQQYLSLRDDIDKNCWVLDPKGPNKKQNYCRIALDENTSVIITFTSLNVQQLPNLKFFGPRNSTMYYDKIITKNYENWNSNNEDILQELLTLLGMSAFPQERTFENSEEVLLVKNGECCICFSLKSNEKLPEIVCSNNCCNQFFHTICLFQWFSSLNPIVSGNEISGNCPNCEKIIYCPVVNNYNN